ncbi:hypothetical protein TVAG_197130 [Trichomonas vaginalis G3]|uniref:Sec23/Sec24 zinc finger family protein n=1 Tax=Trichomonas vaginalis (strain ATCC PRA-98 / G3) TaxID=412133 RepID=A2EPI3_TRIV3|nr:Sec23/24 zinc finger domain family [Trichomonas vaginalis G3]EAY05412.1 hypothetical protein TVAG_197130 [Trichomonas vaginalis G3]KAI5523852.1 Sec23/24 zinc finger domain family [Trichomonas vaginalis G3]|eukprot:XP_001317635.1 hypothetical protein [Trichomonas vaginalis G3]
MNSKLFSQERYKESAIVTDFPQITNTSYSIGKLETPIYFEIMPLHHELPKFEAPEGYTIPVCQNCGAFPVNMQENDSPRWKCHVCGQLNEKKQTHILPSINDFDLCYTSKAKKPLFLFIIQNSSFFTNPDTLSSILATIDEWAVQNPNINLAFFTVGTNITSFDMMKMRTHIYFPDSKLEIPIFSSENCKLSKFIPNIHEEQIIDFNDNVRKIVRKLDTNTPVVMTLFASKCDSSPSLLIKMNNRGNIAVNLYCQHDESMYNLAKNSFKVHIFEDTEGQLISPILRNWLYSDFLFHVHFRFSFQKIFALYDMTIPNSVSGDSDYIPLIDGESGVSVELSMGGNLTRNVAFQASFVAKRKDGSSLIRVFTYNPKRVEEITEFNGLSIGTYLARESAKIILENQAKSHAYEEFYEHCVQMLSAWSQKGQYLKSIDEMFRDAPIMMWSLTQSQLYTTNDKLVMIANAVNYCSLSHLRLIRELYPFFLLPPTTFCNRLDNKNLQNHTTAVLLKAFSGKVFGNIEALNGIDVDNLPLFIVNQEDFQSEMIENNEHSFDYFSEKLEVECNSRRFI